MTTNYTSQSVAPYTLDYVDDEAFYQHGRQLHSVSGYMAAEAYNDICRMIGGTWPDSRLKEEAPHANAFFMALLSTTDPK